MPNTIDVMFPEVWASETLDVLQNRLILGQLVWRDARPTPANVGDVVNVPYPMPFTAQDKTRGGTYVVQDAQAGSLQVLLNKHKHVSFVIEDVERAWSLYDLIELYIEPAAVAVAEAIEAEIANLFTSFTNVVGSLTANLTEATILDARHTLVTNKAPLDGKWAFVLHPDQEVEVLQIARLTEADKVGDGTAIKQALLGRRYDMQFYTSTLVPKTTGAGGPECHNAAFHPQAIALVMRPLPEVPAGLGAQSYVVNRDGYTLRSVVSYDPDRGGVRVTIDALFGVAIARDQFGVHVQSAGK